MTNREDAPAPSRGGVAAYTERRDALRVEHMTAVRDCDGEAVRLCLAIFRAQKTGVAIGAHMGEIGAESFDAKRVAHRLIEATVDYLRSAFESGVLLPVNAAAEKEQALLDRTVEGFGNRLAAEACAERRRQLGQAVHVEEGSLGGFFVIVDESAGGSA